MFLLVIYFTKCFTKSSVTDDFTRTLEKFLTDNEKSDSLFISYKQLFNNDLSFIILKTYCCSL